MDIIHVIITLAVIGLILWLVETYIPMDAAIKQIIRVVVLILVVLWLLQVFGVMSGIGSIGNRRY